MMSLFLEELTGAVFQLVLFSLIPLIWWLITARKKALHLKMVAFYK